jgi:hypothetical protein
MKDGLTIDEDGDKEWYLNGRKHRVDGPALEYHDGYKQWFLNGKLHREDGPAIERPTGDKVWYIDDKLVFSNRENNLHKFKNLSEKLKMSIIKYRLLGPVNGLFDMRDIRL